MGYKPEVEAYFAKQPPGIEALARAMAARVDELAPHTKVALAWGFPHWTGRTRILAVIAEATYVKLQLWRGADLAEQFDAIEGTGKSLRNYKVHSVEGINEEFDTIVKAAVALDRAG